MVRPQHKYPVLYEDFVALEFCILAARPVLKISAILLLRYTTFVVAFLCFHCKKQVISCFFSLKKLITVKMRNLRIFAFKLHFFRSNQAKIGILRSGNAGMGIQTGRVLVLRSTYLRSGGPDCKSSVQHSLYRVSHFEMFLLN